jgi:hypothetical protein
MHAAQRFTSLWFNGLQWKKKLEFISSHLKSVDQQTYLVPFEIRGSANFGLWHSGKGQLGFLLSNQGCQIFLGSKYQNGKKYTKLTRTIPNGRKMDQVSIK